MGLFKVAPHRSKKNRASVDPIDPVDPCSSDSFCEKRPIDFWTTHRFPTGWGPRSIAFSWFIFVTEKTMVYGRYNELVNGDYFMVYKPT